MLNDETLQVNLEKQSMKKKRYIFAKAILISFLDRLPVVDLRCHAVTESNINFKHNSF